MLTVHEQSRARIARMDQNSSNTCEVKEICSCFCCCCFCCCSAKRQREDEWKHKPSEIELKIHSNKSAATILVYFRNFAYSECVISIYALYSQSDCSIHILPYRNYVRTEVKIGKVDVTQRKRGSGNNSMLKC